MAATGKAAAMPGGVRPDERRWNHNIHYGKAVEAALPMRCGAALDVGCGEGLLTRRLRQRADLAVGMDLDAASLRWAREQGGAAYVRGDVLAAPFRPGSFDVVLSVAVLHHMDARNGLTAMASLLRPGGTLAVVGLARQRLLPELPRLVAAAAWHRVLRVRYGLWEHPAPTCWPPPLTYAEMAALAAEVLPGSRFRRHLLWRYSLVWRKP